ncbi:MAG: ImuA family protein [Rhizobiaceae bacterium]
MEETLSLLRRRLAALDPAGARREQAAFGLGLTSIDDALAGGLARGGLHEILPAADADAAAASGFAAGLALRAMAEAGARRDLVWVRQSHVEREAGALYAPGLSAFGLDPSRLILVGVRDMVGVLRAGVEAARCAGLGAVIMEPWGNHRALDLTATRRLALAAEKSGVTVFLLRPGAREEASAVLTRWRVAACPSTALAANAPGGAVFDVTLLRHRAGPAGMKWRLEWDHEHHHFRRATPLSGPVVSVPAARPVAARFPLARTG